MSDPDATGYSLKDAVDDAIVEARTLTATAFRIAGQTLRSLGRSGH